MLSPYNFSWFLNPPCAAPYIPPIDPSNASDTQNFDDTFLDMEPVLDDINDEQLDTDQEPDQTDTDRTDGDDSNTTPSQSRSSSIRPQQQVPVDDSIDLFDGYSFKGRYSVLIDEDEDEEGDGSEEASEEEEEEELLNNAVLAALEQTQTPTETPAVDDAVEEMPDEPKTPEARPVSPLEPVPENLPILPTKPATELPRPGPLDVVPPPPPSNEPESPQPRKSKELPPPAPLDTVPPNLPEKEAKAKVVVLPKPPVTRPATNRTTRPRREKSGVHALDRYLSDAIDEDPEVIEREDDEDDDWDFVEPADGEDRNGTKGTSLFARGVVDRYRLAVFRKASTPSQRPSAQRTSSGMSKSSQATVSDTGDSPSPSQKRGRAPLNFRKHPRQFLRPKSPPPSSFSSKSSGTAKSISHTNTISQTSSSGLLTPSPSFGAASHSLKSKESAASVGALSSSDQSGNGDIGGLEPIVGLDTAKSSRVIEEPERQKNKKLKKYKENAEKVFSLFSPRQPSRYLE
jgi:serum/glucocorticoid-regulated kinase 2